MYNSDIHKEEWEKIQPEINACLDEGFSLKQFFNFMNWDSRESWYRLKPKGFHWDKELKARGHIIPKGKEKEKEKKQRGYQSLDELKLEKIKEDEARERTNRNQRERFAICQGLGVKSLRQAGCKSVKDYRNKLAEGKAILGKKKKEEKEEKEEVKSISVSGVPIESGKALLVVCNTDEISRVLSNIKAGLAG